MKTNEGKDVSTFTFGERCEVLGGFFDLIENNQSTIPQISRHITNNSPSIVDTYLRHINYHIFYTSARDEVGEKILNINQGLEKYGLSSLIDVIINTKNSNEILSPFLERSSLLGQNVYSFLENVFPYKGIQDSKILKEDRMNAQTFALLFGLDSLLFLDLAVRGKRVGKKCVKEYNSMSCVFNVPIHSNMPGIAKKVFLPDYILERGKESRKIPGANFSFYHVTEAMNFMMAIQEIGFLESRKKHSPHEIILSKEILRERKKGFYSDLEHFLDKVKLESKSGDLDLIKKFSVFGNISRGDL